MDDNLPDTRVGDVVIRCRRLARNVVSGYIEVSEIGYTCIAILVHAAMIDSRAREMWPACLNELGTEELKQMSEWCNENLVPVAYRFCSAAFIPDVTDQQDVRRKGEELEPLFRELHSLIAASIEIRS